MKDTNTWVDSAVNAKSPQGEATSSWWASTSVGNRDAFDREAAANQRRMARSRFGRLAVPMGDKGYGDSA